MVNGAEILMGLVGNGVFGTPLSFPAGTVMTDELLAQVFDLAKAHDVAPVVAYALDKNNLLFGSAFEGLYRDVMYDAVIKGENQSYTLQKVSDAFEKAKIPHIPLKGSVIKALYPESWLRTSRDIDVLIHKEDLPKAEQELYSLGFEKMNDGKHDVSFVNGAGVCLELHFTLMEEEKSKCFAKIPDRVWDFAAPCNDSFTYTLNDEMFYFYHLAHMAKHFRSGGCGLRPFVDLWLMNRAKNYGTPQVRTLLEAGGLDSFDCQARALCEVWFEGKAHTEVTLAAEEFILKGGLFGTTKTRAAASSQVHGGDEKYFLSRVFVPYDYLKNIYPVLKKHKFLLPFFEIVRIFSLLFGRKKELRKRNVNAAKNINNEEAQRLELVFDSFGIKNSSRK